MSCNGLYRSGNQPLISRIACPVISSDSRSRDVTAVRSIEHRQPAALVMLSLPAIEPGLAQRADNAPASAPMNSCKHIRKSGSNEAAAPVGPLLTTDRAGPRVLNGRFSPEAAGRAMDGAGARSRHTLGLIRGTAAREAGPHDAQSSPRMSCCRRVMYAFMASSASLGLRRRIASATPRVISSWERAMECQPPIFFEMKNHRRR